MKEKLKFPFISLLKFQKILKLNKIMIEKNDIITSFFLSKFRLKSKITKSESNFICSFLKKVFY